MANLPLRSLGEIGVVTDVSPFDLPPNALTMGGNIRCTSKKIVRAPVFRTVLATTAATPVFSWVYKAPGENDAIGIADRTGTLYFYKNGVETDVTPSSFTPAGNDSPHSSCTLANVNYINRDSAVPMYYNKSSVDFDELPNWDVNHRARSLRAYGDQLIAINITKSAVNFPNMIKASDITTIDNYPSSWDHTIPSNSAYENTLNECKSTLVDGLALGDVFFIYADDQVWIMRYTADNDIFAVKKHWDNIGIIGVNCVVEVEGKHYVFGRDDIYTHNGVAYESICEGRVKNFIFNSVNKSEANKFSVIWNPSLREVLFSYVSGDGYTAFTGTAYCNRGMAYNVDTGQWTPRDMPNTGLGTFAALSLSATYASITSLYSTVGGSYADMEDAAEKALFFPSPSSTPGGLTASRLYGYDEASGGRLTQAINTEATKKAWAQRVGIDLDEVQLPLNVYKSLKVIYPQADGLGETGNFSFKFAGFLYPDPNATPSWTPLQSFDPASGYKVDVPKLNDKLVGGRYLAWYWENSSNFGSELSGFDSEVISLGKK